MALAARQTDEDWFNQWRPAPAHLVEEWRSLGSSTKASVWRAREALMNGDTQVFLRSCGLGDAGAAVIAEVMRQCTRLRVINVSGNGIGDSGALRLAEALQGVKEAEVLWLSGNRIGDAGATQLAGLFERGPRLRILGLDSNRVTDQGASNLVAALLNSDRKDCGCSLADNPVMRLGPKALTDLSGVAKVVSDMSQKGITLGQLLALYAEAVGQGTIIPKKTTTGQFVHETVMPRCKTSRKSYVDAMTPDNPPPTAHVIHAWDAYFEDLVSAVASHACGRRRPSLDLNDLQWRFSPELTGKSYFIDIFCVNQHIHTDVRAYGALSQFSQLPAFQLGETGCMVDKLHLVASRIQARGGRVLVVVDCDNVLLTRAHCLYEIRHAIRNKTRVDVIFSGLSTFPSESRGDMLQKAKASSDRVKELVLNEVADFPGGFDSFNREVLEFIDLHADSEFDALLDRFQAKLAAEAAVAS
mmetsp:Transcript_19578/g.42795  ORF Transcript_19578/g.42795 Transcript_19578/m.42795 type:complete len:471 (+) Transcript_19578:34-1446(+)